MHVTIGILTQACSILICALRDIFDIYIIFLNNSKEKQQLKDSSNPLEFVLKSHIHDHNTFHLHFDLLLDPLMQN